MNGTTVWTRVNKYTLSALGVSSANVLVTLQGKIVPSEVELSHDQSKLAFARSKPYSVNTSVPNTDLVVLNLDANGDLLTTNKYDILNDDALQYTGIEFDPTTTNLYLNRGGDGIHIFTLSPGTFNYAAINSSSYDYTWSQLELSDYTGKEYKVINVSSDIGNKSLCNINIRDLPSGNYVLGLKAGTEVLKTQRFTKQ